MQRRLLEVLMLVVWGSACSADVGQTEKPIVIETSCSIAALRSLLATDSSQLRLADRSALSGQTTEGGEVAVFYDGSTPRMIRASFFGETGQSQELYYLIDSMSFVRTRTEHRYVSPIAVEPNPSIASTVADTVWVCKGNSQAVANSAAVEDALTTARRLLRAPS